MDFRNIKVEKYSNRFCLGLSVSTLELSTTENNPGMKGFCVAGLVDLNDYSFCKFSVGGKWAYFSFTCILYFSQCYS